ncbi:MAG: hypothetical protein AB1333_00245 [Patescibacteria group bacterium]
MTKNGEKIREELKKEIIDTLLRSAKRNENKTFLYLSDIDEVGPSYIERVGFLESLKKSGVITKFKEVEKVDQFEEWDELEIERDPESWIDYKENFSPEKRIYAKVFFCSKKILAHFPNINPKKTIGIQKLITRKSGEFFYDGILMKMPNNRNYYRDILNILLSNERTDGFIEYGKINAELMKKGHKIITDPKKIRDRIRNALNNGFFRYTTINGERINKNTPDGRKLIELGKKGDGLVFNNIKTS